MSRGEGGYRPDIDGLRAIAVLSVLLYHLDAPLLSGGYVGVDIFFVISGFLITRNIWTDLEDGTFSIRGFYLRRIRRIAPAFVVMAAITLVAGCLLLLPEDLRRLGSSTGAAALSASNVYFAFTLDTGYFADTSDQEPMLHTWSLGVEEQFYLLWPVTLLALRGVLPRFRGRGPDRWSARRWAVGATLLILVASFAIGERLLDIAPEMAYFMLPARAGELMTGAMLAFLLRRPADAERAIAWMGSRRRRVVAEGAGITGMALIAWSLTQLDDGSPFPGINAIPPALGSMLVILAGGLGGSLVSRVLGLRPMVAIGLISYSLYLWHWPVLAFARYFYGSLDATQLVVLVPPMFALAAASYRWVEQPARSWRARPRIQAGRLFVAPTSALLLASAVLLATNGLTPIIAGSPAFATRLAALTSQVKPALDFDYNCQQSRLEPGVLAEERCRIGLPGAVDVDDPRALLWGDSHAAAAVGLLGAVAEANDRSFRNASFSSCPPLFGGAWGAVQTRKGCGTFRDRVRAAVAEGRFDVIILGAGWSIYDRDPTFLPTLEQTVRDITAEGVHVVVLGQVPQFPTYQRQCAARALRFPVDCEALVSRSDAGASRTELFVQGLADRIANVSYLSVRDWICRDATCSPYLDGEALYYNVGHLSMDGSWRLGGLVAASAEGAAWATAIWGTTAAGSATP